MLIIFLVIELLAVVLPLSAASDSQIQRGGLTALVFNRQPPPNETIFFVDLSFYNVSFTDKLGVTYVNYAKNKTIAKWTDETYIKDGFAVRRFFFPLITFAFEANGTIALTEYKHGFVNERDLVLINTTVQVSSPGRTQCKTTVGSLPLKDIFTQTVNNQVPFRNQLEKALKTYLEEWICKQFKITSRVPEIQERLSDYEDVQLTKDVSINNKKLWVERRPTSEVWEIVLSARAEGKTSQPKLTSTRPISDFDFCFQNARYGVVMAVTENVFFSSIVREVLLDKPLSYEFGDFAQQDTVFWNILKHTAETYGKKVKGRFNYQVKLTGLKWTCKEKSCKISGKAEANLGYWPAGSPVPADHINFTSAFEAEIAPKINSMTILCTHAKCLKPNVNYLHLYGVLLSFKLTGNSIFYFRQIRGLTSPKEIGFEKDAFQNETLHSILFKVISKGVQIVHPLHKEQPLINLEWKIGHAKDETIFCIAGDFKEHPQLEHGWTHPLIRVTAI